MRRLAVLLVLLSGLLSACRTLDRFEVDGDVRGLADFNEGPEGFDWIIVHGMGGFYADDPEPLLKAFAQECGLVRAAAPKDEHVEFEGRYYGRIRRHILCDESGEKLTRVYVFHWTGVTAKAKELYLGYDTELGESAGREELNDAIKRRLVNSNLSDLALYLGKHAKAVHIGLQRVFAKVNEESHGEERGIGIVTYSLGAKIVTDVLGGMAMSDDPADQKLAARVFDRLRYMGMLANQLAMHELTSFNYDEAFSDGSGEPKIVISPELRRFDRELRDREDAQGRDRLPILAISDPNDMLSFSIPPWLKKEMPDRFVNAWVSVADTSYWVPFFFWFAPPDDAHRKYSHSGPVKSLLMRGYSQASPGAISKG